MLLLVLPLTLASMQKRSDVLFVPPTQFTINVSEPFFPIDTLTYPLDRLTHKKNEPSAKRLILFPVTFHGLQLSAKRHSIHWSQRRESSDGAARRASVIPHHESIPSRTVRTSQISSWTGSSSPVRYVF